MNHFNVSIVKSLLRIIACILGIAVNIELLCILLLLAELLGIVEEFVDKRKEV